MNEKFDMSPTKRELIRVLVDIMLRMLFYNRRGDWQYIHLEASRYDFMWQVWIETIQSYMSAPEPEYHHELIAPRWFIEWQERHP